MLDMSGQLNQRAAGLAADAKQKISLGRGLVRSDVSAVLFDEPLTVIDPHLKWQLRRKLKQIHRELKLTLIYVTHDQVEALTFAEQVVVMTRGKAVQVGSAEALFERPAAHLRRPLHRLAGHELPAGAEQRPARCDVAGTRLSPHARAARGRAQARHPARVRRAGRAERAGRGAGAASTQVQDVGTHLMLTAPGRRAACSRRGCIRTRAVPAAGEPVWLQVLGAHTCFYRTRSWWHERHQPKPINQKAWCWCCRCCCAWPSRPSCR